MVLSNPIRRRQGPVPVVGGRTTSGPCIPAAPSGHLRGQFFQKRVSPTSSRPEGCLRPLVTGDCPEVTVLLVTLTIGRQQGRHGTISSWRTFTLTGFLASLTDSSIATGTLHAPIQRSTPSHRSSASVSSVRSRESASSASRATLTGVMNTDRRGNRRERTFVGSECAVCEEPLEHTLQGERILQFSCSHVSHEACFYEFIREMDGQYCPTCNAPLHLDTSRGGNVLDIGETENGIHTRLRNTGTDRFPTEKISNMVRSVSVNDSRSQGTPTPTPMQGWDDQTVRPPSGGSNARTSDGYQTRSGDNYQVRPDNGYQVRSGDGYQARSSDGYQSKASDGYQPRASDGYQSRASDSYQSRSASVPANGRESAARGSVRDSRDAPSDRYPQSRHARSDSEATGVASSGGYPETTQSGPPRRHDYDVQAMETSLASPRAVTRNPIPAPVVTVKSEFPTVNRSRQQQTLTCLVTIEVSDIKWRPDPEDLHTGEPAMPLPPAPPKQDQNFTRPPSPARSVPRFYPYESDEVLQQVTENLQGRVDNWHGLDFGR